MNDLVSVARAYHLASRWHSAQRRKGEAAEPYVNHLAEVAHLVTAATRGADPDLVIAAVLHDAVEDAGITPEHIAGEFGQDVCDLVLEVTDDKRLPKEERKRLQVQDTPQKSDRAKMIKLADKTSNLRDILHAPPPWPKARRQAYLDWALQVAAGARGVNAQLEEGFDEAAAQLAGTLAREG